MKGKKYQAKLKEIERLDKEIEDNKAKRKHIVERLLDLEKEKTIYNECIDLFTFFEYNTLKPQFEQGLLNKFDKAKFLILRAITNMVQFDPKYGLKKKDMSDEDYDHWENIDNDLQQGASILYTINGRESLYDDHLWCLIPSKLGKYIKSQFGKII